MTTYEEATTTRTQPEILEDDIAALDAKGVYASGWSDLSVHRGVMETNSRSLAREEQIRSDVTKAGFLDTVVASGISWAKRLFKGYFNLELASATKAVHKFRLTNLAAAGPYNIKIGELTVKTLDGIEFANSGAGTLLSGIGQTRDVEFTADLAGISGNIAANSALAFEQGLPGVAITNPPIGSTGTSITTAGRDEEGAESGVDRCIARWGATAAGAGVGSYVEWIAEAFVQAGIPNTITRWRVDDTNPNGPGSVDVYIGNAAGAATADELAMVTTYLHLRHPKGAGPLRVMSATVVAFSVAGTVYARGNASAVAQAQTALNARAASTQLGGGVIYYAQIIEDIMGVSGVYNLVLSAPTGDIIFGVNEIPAFTYSLVLG